MWKDRLENGYNRRSYVRLSGVSERQKLTQRCRSDWIPLKSSGGCLGVFPPFIAKVGRGCVRLSGVAESQKLTKRCRPDWRPSEESGGRLGVPLPLLPRSVENIVSMVSMKVGSK